MGLGLALALALAIPIKLWKRGHSGFEIRVSALDLMQAYALGRSAERAEQRGQGDLAISSWSLALANDPFNEGIAVRYLEALLRSKRHTDTSKALQMAAWLQGFSKDPRANDLLIAAADRNQDWSRILEVSRSAQSQAELAPNSRLSVVRAFFRTGGYQRAIDYLNEFTLNDEGARETYRLALECILNSGAGQAAARISLRDRLDSASSRVEAHEVYLVVCAETRDLMEFQQTLEALKQLTDQTLPFDLLHSRLLWDMGRRNDAWAVAARFPTPVSGIETFRIAQAFIAVGQNDEALLLLRRYCPEFFDTIIHWILYAEILLDQGDKDGLRALAARLPASVTPFNAITSAITLYLQPGRKSEAKLSEALQSLPRDLPYTSIWYFVADASMASGNSDLAANALTSIEPIHLQDLEFYDRLFRVAESGRNAGLMRRAAERRYLLAPHDLFAIGNHAAMLTIFDELPDKAVELSAACARAQPESLPAKINHAAALINVEHFGSADLILKQIDEMDLLGANQSQLRFIKLKRAIKLGDQSEALRLQKMIDKSHLYSRQIEWLSEHQL